jgi:hypothetical protein
VFNKHTAPATAGSNVVLISNSELLGQPTGRGMFVNWNNFTMTGSFLAGSAGNVFEVGDNAFVTTLSGGTIGGGGLSTGYCVASQAGTPTRSLFITGTVVTSGCTLGNFNDPGAAMILDLPAGYPPLKPMTAISGCGDELHGAADAVSAVSFDPAGGRARRVGQPGERVQQSDDGGRDDDRHMGQQRGQPRRFDRVLHRFQMLGFVSG